MAETIYFEAGTEGLDDIIKNLNDENLTSFFRECKDRNLMAQLQDGYGECAKQQATIPLFEVKTEMQRRGLDTSYQPSL